MEKLKQYRMLKGLSSKKMAKQIGVSYSFYCKIEQGVLNPSYSFLVKLKEKFSDVNIDEVIFSKTKRP